MSSPWLAPDARPGDEPAPHASRPTTRSRDEAVDAVDVPMPLPMRPMTVADVLDGAIEVIKAAPRSVIIVAGALVVPLELVSAWVQRDTLADRGLSGALSAATSPNSSDLGITGATIVLL
ncbi:MAG TPA: hypothetical protein VGZ52_12770, partial [Acidimicrobiales bacterium]|nr:hypothetical protein [Acidimicrobiales bacterium]